MFNAQLVKKIKKLSFIVINKNHLLKTLKMLRKRLLDLFIKINLILNLRKIQKKSIKIMKIFKMINFLDLIQHMIFI